MLIEGTVCMCETRFLPISQLPVNLVTTFHQFRRDFVIAIYGIQIFMITQIG